MRERHRIPVEHDSLPFDMEELSRMIEKEKA
jgi:hypothetical protein